MLRVVSRHALPPPGVRSPVEWGTPARLRELLGHATTELRLEERVFTFRHRSGEEFADFFLTHYGPTERAAATLDEPGRAALRADLVGLAERANRLPAGGPVAIPPRTSKRWRSARRQLRPAGSANVNCGIEGGGLVCRCISSTAGCAAGSR